jgi:hypothetical protein
MRREAPYARPQLATFVLVACSCLPILGLSAQDARHSARKLPKIELKLSGPTTIRPSESLTMQRYSALLTNRSSEPLVLLCARAS